MAGLKVITKISGVDRIAGVRTILGHSDPSVSRSILGIPELRTTSQTFEELPVVAALLIEQLKILALGCGLPHVDFHTDYKTITVSNTVPITTLGCGRDSHLQTSLRILGAGL